VVNDWPGTTAADAAAAKLETADTKEPSDKKKRTIRRRLFDVGNTFLDSWFGLRKP